MSNTRAIHRQTLESMFKGMLDNEIQLDDILSALHHICAHGDIMIKNGFPPSKEDLEDFYDGLEKALKAAQSIYE